MEPVFASIYARPEPKQPDPTFTEYLGAAFRLENPVVNLYDSLTEPVFHSDPDFNPIAEAKELGLPMNWLPSLAHSRSREQFNYERERLEQETNDQITLAAAGTPGILTAMVAGVLSPTTLIPFTAGGKGLKLITEAMILAGGSAVLDESVLMMNQRTRTYSDALMSVSSAALLGGMLGSAGAALGRRGLRQLEAEVATGQRTFTAPEEISDTGYAPRKVLIQTGTTAVERVRDPVRDIPATPTAIVEPPAPSKGVRIYFAGKDTGEVLASSDRIYAASNHTSQPFYYIDLPADDVRLADAEVRTELGKPVVVQLTREEAQKGKEIFRGADDADAVDMAPFIKQEAIPTEGEVPVGRVMDDVDMDLRPAGADINRTIPRNTRGVDMPQNAAARFLMERFGKISPHFRMAQSFLPSAKDFAFKADDGGLRQAGLREAQGSAFDGTLQSRIDIHLPQVVKVEDAVNEDYYRYLYPDAPKEPGPFRAFLTQLKGSNLLVPEGKMTFAEFEARIYDGHSTGNIEPEFAKSARALKDFFKYFSNLQNDYMDEIQTDTPLYKELAEDELGQGVENYAHQLWDGPKIIDNSAEFVRDVSDWAQRSIEESFKRAHEKYLKNIARMDEDLRYASLTPEQKRAHLEDIVTAIEELDNDELILAWKAERADVLAEVRNGTLTPEEGKLRLKEIDDNAGDEVKGILSLRKELMARARRMKNLGGDAEAQIEKLRAQIEAVEMRAEKGLKKIIADVGKIDLDIDKAGANFAKNLDKFEKGLITYYDRMIARNKALKATLARGGDGTQIASRRAAYDKAVANYEAHKNSLELALARARQGRLEVDELRRLREDVIQNGNNYLMARGGRIEELNERIDLEKAKIRTPEEQAAEVENLRRTRDAYDENFHNRWHSRGAVGDIGKGEVDFSARATDEAVTLMRTLTTKGDGTTPSMFLARMDKRGPQLERVLKMPYAIKSKWLNRSVGTVVRAYARQMGPDLELWRATGSANARAVIEGMELEAHELISTAQRAKYFKPPARWHKVTSASGRAQRLAAAAKNAVTSLFGPGVHLSLKNFSDEAGEGFIEMTDSIREKVSYVVNEELSAQIKNVDHAVNRLRNTVMVPENPNSIAWRAGSAIKAMNVPLMMGNVVISSIPDIAQPVFKFGVMNTLGKAWVPMIMNLKSSSGKGFRVQSRRINRQIGLNIEPYLHMRSQAFFDTGAEYAAGKTKLERGIKFLSQKTGLVAMFDFWTAGMKSVAAAVTHATLAAYIPEVADALRRGTATGGDAGRMLEHLRQLGLTDSAIMRIDAQMKIPGAMEEFSNGGKLPNFDVWEDNSAFRAYAAAVTSDANRMIITPGLERPNWTDQNLAYSMVAQFKSFSFAALSRIMLASLQGNNPYLLQGITLSLALGAVAYYTSAWTRGGKAYEKAQELDPEDWIYEAVDRSGLLNVLSLGQKVGEQIPVLAQYSIFGGADQAYRRPTGLAGSLFGPTAGQFEKLTELLKNLGSENESEKARVYQNLRMLFVPYQNVFYINLAFRQLAGE